MRIKILWEDRFGFLALFLLFLFLLFKLCHGTDKFEMLTIWITLENCKKEKIKTANCTRISRLSLSLVRNSTFRIYVSTNAATSISDIEQPIAFQRFLPYQKLSSISITIHPFRSLFLLLPRPIPQTSSSTKPETSIPKNRSIG